MGVMNGGERIEVTSELVTNEIIDQTGQSPARCAISRHGTNPATRTATWIASFKTEVAPFRLFNSECSSHLIKRRPRVTHHALGCQGWCNPLKCRKEPCCNTCGKEIRFHQDMPYGSECENAIKCAICNGPHKAGDNCPAKPRVVHGRLIRPTTTQLRDMRAANAEISRVAARANTVSPRETTPSPQSQSSRVSEGVPIEEPSNSAPTRKRKGAAVDEYEKRGSSSTATTSNRNPRATRYLGSQNEKHLSDKVHNTLGLSNPFSSLASSSLEETEMEIDISDESS
jgi:hypothetical protein